MDSAVFRELKFGSSEVPLPVELEEDEEESDSDVLGDPCSVSCVESISEDELPDPDSPTADKGDDIINCNQDCNENEQKKCL